MRLDFIVERKMGYVKGKFLITASRMLFLIFPPNSLFLLIAHFWMEIMYLQAYFEA